MSTSGLQELALLDQASRLLAQASTLPEIKSFHDKLGGVQYYIREARLGLARFKPSCGSEAASRKESRLHAAPDASSRRRSTIKGTRCPFETGEFRHFASRVETVATHGFDTRKEFCEYFRISNELGEEATFAGLLRLAAHPNVCERAHLQNPRCQIEPALCDGLALPETAWVPILVELANYFRLISNVLQPLCANHELEFQSWQRRIVG